MDIQDLLLEGNAAYVANRDPAEATMGATPRLGLAVVACMDTRNAVEQVLGLKHGDAKIIRNAGNRVSDDALRSLVVAVHLLGARKIAVMGHTKCGMTLIGQGDTTIEASVAEHTDAEIADDFHGWLGGFEDSATHVKDGVERVRNHPLMPADVEVFGLLFDNETGRVTKVA
ncbi:MAG: beta-class carbonic anhydrase [Thermoplasmatota archaeon]